MNTGGGSVFHRQRWVIFRATLTFGGVPREILFDQMRAVVTRDLRLEGGRLVENAEFLRFVRRPPIGVDTWERLC